MLSDLKESGCISVKNNINIINIKTQAISLTENNAVKYIDYIYNKKNTQHNNQQVLSLPKQRNLVSIKNKYLFNIIKTLGSLKITFNHKSLNKNTWITTSQIGQNIKTNIFINKKKYLVQQKYTKEIIFTSYSRSYDINKHNYYNIICEMNIIHNSIEQDADIIIILYEMQNTKYNYSNSTERIIDLKISKNRNGQTGYCQLLFEPNTNIFKNVI